MLIQSNEHSYTVVSRNYTNLNWQNKTQVFSTNPCFLKKLFTAFRLSLLHILRKHGFVEKNCVLFSQFKIRLNDWTSIYKLCQLFFPSWGEECVTGRINVNLWSKIRYTGFDLTGHVSWFTTKFWIFTTEFFVIMSLFTTRKKQKALELPMNLWYLSITKVILTLQTPALLNFVFLGLILLHLWNQKAMGLY